MVIQGKVMTTGEYNRMESIMLQKKEGKSLFLRLDRLFQEQKYVHIFQSCS